MMDILRKKTEKKVSLKKGFSLIEVLVALFVFSILVATLSGVYMGFLGAQFSAKRTQRMMEDSQQALNLLAKTLRTSKIVAPATSSNDAVGTIRIYDYSKNGTNSACLEYAISGEKLYLRSSSAVLTENACTSAAVLDTEMSLIDGRVFGGFIVKLNDATNSGKMTTSIQLCPKGSAVSSCGAVTGNSVKIQTTVSLRVNQG